MRPDRQYSSQQKRFQSQIIPLNLACGQALEELIALKDRRVFPEYPSRLHLFRDSLDFYSDPSRYKGSTEKRNLLLQTFGEEYVLKEMFKEEDKSKARKIYSDIKSLLDSNNPHSASQVKTSERLIADITHLLERGLFLVSSPPSDIPTGVRQFAANFSQK